MIASMFFLNINVIFLNQSSFFCSDLYMKELLTMLMTCKLKMIHDNDNKTGWKI